MCSERPECLSLVTSLSRAAVVKCMEAWNAFARAAMVYSDKRMGRSDFQEIQWASRMATVEKKAMHTEF